ncbi:amidohydrolase [Candidatus Omnitrophota bacterium]
MFEDNGKFMTSLLMVLPLFLLFLSCAVSPLQPADLVLRGGKIATVDDSFSFAEAVAVRGDTLCAVGSNEEIKPYIGPQTTIIELGGKLVIPGLIDAHVHLRGYGISLLSLDFRGTTSFGQIIDMVAEKAKTLEPGEWILGRSWDQNDWDIKKLPSHKALSNAVPDNPVYITRVDGHAAIVNKKGMDMAGITARTKDPDGGEIIRTTNGRPTGVFIDRAMGLVSKMIPDNPPERTREAIVLAGERCLEAGLTGVHDAGTSTATIDHYKYLIDNDKLGIRVYAMLHPPAHEGAVDYLKKNRLIGYGGNFLTVRSIKLFIDGALGSRGALMFEPYSDRPGYSGLTMNSGERALELSLDALAAGFQMCTHAIGDMGNSIILDAYEQALRKQPSHDHRFRVEHAQIVSLNDIPRFSASGVLPSMQPTHATSDMYWAEDRVGPERIKGAYAWRKFLDSGTIIPCGSDCPVEEINPMLGLYAAITRQDNKGWPEGGWYPEENMTREEALRGFTIWAAYSAFQENILGSIEPGKLADMVVLSKDILTVPAEEILTTVPEYTIVGGKIRYVK